MTLVHPVYVSSLNSIPLLIGKDLLNRFEPLIDFKRLKLWAQVRQPLPFIPPRTTDMHCYVLEAGDGNSPTSLVPSPPTVKDTNGFSLAEAFLCTLVDSPKGGVYSPRVENGINLEGANVTDAVLALWSEKSAISRKTFESLLQSTPDLKLVEKAFRFPLDPAPRSMTVSQGVCNLMVQWGSRSLNHSFLVLPDVLHDIYVGSDLIVRLGGQLDTVNNTLWSLSKTKTDDAPLELADLKSGQTIPEACQVSTACHFTIPARTKDVPIRLNILPGQTLDHSRAFFQPSRMFNNLGLSLDATHMVDVNSRFTYLLVQNDTFEEIIIPKSTPLGWLISANFHDFELRVPVIGRIPSSLFGDAETDVVHTKPLGAITLFSLIDLDDNTVCRVEMNDTNEMVVQAIERLSPDFPQKSAPTFPAACSATDSCNSVTSPANEKTTTDFASQVDKVIAEADALSSDEECNKLRIVLLKYETSFAHDSLDCGLTSLHTVRVPTPPGAPPTYVRQYKIPLASHGPIQEIIDDLLDKGIIQPCNSTYSAPLWPVLKPNGKWRLTIDYRKLNQQIPLSRWPMARIEQDLPKIKNAKFFSSLDIASGFWTLPVHAEDQHKLAFNFANRQYTFTRCPFGYANSPAEFNIFLNKACADAGSRGTLIYVDDILIRNQTLDEHIEEIDHVLGQLTTAGAKISLAKCQWGKTAVNYVGLLVGSDGVKPQESRIQGVANIEPPQNVSQLRSFQLRGSSSRAMLKLPNLSQSC